MKVLVVGRDGQVARALAHADPRGVTSLGRPDLDLERVETFAPALVAHAPDVVACVGAYTAVDQAEAAPDQALRVNAIGPGRLAEICAEHAVPIIHVSTDYVFDGAKPAPYVETDPVAPRSVYGRTKAEGEARVAAGNRRHVIVRTGWVYDAAGRNFVRTMLRLASSQNRVRVVADQFGAPTFAPHIAAGLLTIAHNLTAAPADKYYGVFHMTAADDCSWADFAEAIFAESVARGGPGAVVDRITTAQYPTAAQRPANARLSCDRIARVHGVRLAPWRDGLAQCMDEIAAGGWVIG